MTHARMISGTHVDGVVSWAMQNMDALAFLRDGGPGEVRLDGVTDALARKLAACAHLATVTALDFTGGRIGEKGARALAESPHVRGLRSLSLSQCHAKDGVLVALAESSSLVSLRALDLEWNEFSARGWKALTHASALPALEDLRVPSNDLGPVGWTTLVASPLMARLCALDLAMTRPTAKGLEALFEAKAPRLRELRLMTVGLDASAIERLLSWPVREQLTALDASHNNLPPHVAAMLVSAAWPALERLSLRATGLQAGVAPGAPPALDALVALARALAFPVLRSLDLSANGLTPEGAKALAQAKGLRALEELNALENPLLGDDGHRALRTRFGAAVHLPAPKAATPATPAPTPATATTTTTTKSRPAKPLPLRKLEAFARKSPFRQWKPDVPAALIAASTTLVANACNELLALGVDATPAAQRKVLRACVLGFNALDRKHHFIQTPEAEDISGVIDELADHTSLVGAEDLAGPWRTW